ncbi:MAG: acyltransferase family protein [Legionella sp.]|nr:acyltransferase family protein [Legionella sp.]
MTNHSLHAAYRADIDGLRAVAVLSVVGFHAFPHWLKGGFIGVDVFFVISGFLISSIIFQGLDNGTLSFTTFYARRIKRIFPALTLILLASFAFGWFVLFTDEYKQLGKHIAGGAAFISNFILWNESGYFDNAAEAKPLLHLWSLGVEEQFYIIWPLLIGLAYKVRWNLFYLLLCIGCISFGLNISKISGDPIGVFYSPLTRIWELTLGSLLAYLTVYKEFRCIPTNGFFSAHLSGLRNIQSLTGICLVFISVIILNKETFFPGWWALLPTVGTYLIISAGQDAWFNRFILSNRLVVLIGLISFPLYLWHWPILSFIRIIEASAPSAMLRLAAILMSLVLAWFTYEWIEKPIRFGNFTKLKLGMLCLVMATIGEMGYYIFTHERMNNDFNGVHNLINSAKRSEHARECFDIPEAHKRSNHWFCHLNKKDDKPALIFVYGDSHALNFLPVLEDIALRRDVDILFTGFSGCPPLLGIYSIRGDQTLKNCHDLNERVFNFVINNGITDVFLMARWTYYTDGRYGVEEINFLRLFDKTDEYTKEASRIAFEEGLNKTISNYTNAGVGVHIVKDTPMQLQNLKDLFRQVQMSLNVKNPQKRIDDLSVSLKQHKKLQKFVNARIETYKQKNSVDIIDLDNIYCPSKVCPFANKTQSYYFDSDHLSISGARLATKIFQNRFDLIASDGGVF